MTCARPRPRGAVGHERPLPRDRHRITEGVSGYGFAALRAEPIWVTAVRQGRRAAAFFWPGSDVAIGGVRPHHVDVPVLQEAREGGAPVRPTCSPCTFEVTYCALQPSMFRQPVRHARNAMRLAILRGRESGVPVFPYGLTASISHCVESV